MISNKTEYEKALSEIHQYEEGLISSLSWEELAEFGYKWLAIRKCKQANKEYTLPGAVEVVKSFLEG
jgi:hypothetical protein